MTMPELQPSAPISLGPIDDIPPGTWKSGARLIPDSALNEARDRAWRNQTAVDLAKENEALRHAVAVMQNRTALVEMITRWLRDKHCTIIDPPPMITNEKSLAACAEWFATNILAILDLTRPEGDGVSSDPPTSVEGESDVRHTPAAGEAPGGDGERR